jgi:uncharacterized membrane protein
MARLIHALILGLVGAGVAHIAVLLLIPAYSQRDAWSVLSEQSNYYTLTLLNPQGAKPLIGSIDPLFLAAACRFDLDDGVLHIIGDSDVPYWSLSVYDRAGQNIYSLNDRSSSGGTPDFVVATPVHMIDLRNALPPEFDRSVFIEADTGEGIVVIRAFAPDETWLPTVARMLQNLRCEAHPLV